MSPLVVGCILGRGGVEAESLSVCHSQYLFVDGVMFFSVRAYFVYTHCKGVRVFTHVGVCIHRYVASPVCQGWPS